MGVLIALFWDGVVLQWMEAPTSILATHRPFFATRLLVKCHHSYYFAWTKVKNDET
jgi:hypothetical protein